MSNNNNNFLVFSHEQDVDGLFAAAVLRMIHPNCEVVLTNYGFENMVAIRNKILSFSQPWSNIKIDDVNNKLNSGTIVIADIGVNEESYKPVYEALNISKKRGFSNIWIDHHPWSEEMKEKFSSVCEMVIYSQNEMQLDNYNNTEVREAAGPIKKCATELCIEHFDVTFPYAKTLGIVAHRTDFPDSAKFPLPPLTGLISYYLGRQELNSKLYSIILQNVTHGILWNIEMQDDMIEAARLIDESIAKSIESMVIREYEVRALSSPAHSDDNRLLPLPENQMKVRVEIAKADSFVSRSILLGKIMDDSEAQVDLAIAFTSDGKLSIRRKDRIPEKTLQLDCRRIAMTFREGGGHPGAAGGFLKTDVGKKGDNAAIIEIESTLQNYFEKLEEEQQQLFQNEGNDLDTDVTIPAASADKNSL